MIKGLDQIIDTFFITSENSRFYLSKNGLLMASVPEKDFEGRVFLSLAFPFETEEEFICVQNEEKEEIGMIESLSSLDPETCSILKGELEKKYFAPKILEITKFREAEMNSYWTCQTDKGVLEFTVRDTHRSLIRIGEDRLYVMDFDGCRYEIESLAALDRKSYSKIQLYL